MGAYSLAQAKGQLGRLIEKALTGEVVTITRNGKPVVTITPATPEPKPMLDTSADEFVRGMEARARARPVLGGDSVTLVREMREESA